MPESHNARDDEELPLSTSEAVAEVVRVHGYDAVRDELAKQAVATTDDDAIVLHRAPGLSDQEWADFCTYSRVWMKLEVAKRRDLAARRPEGEAANRPPALGEPQAYLLHEGMGNYAAMTAQEFEARGGRSSLSRLDPVPLFRCPTYPHERGLVYDAATDEAVCRLCSYRTVNEMGSL